MIERRKGGRTAEGQGRASHCRQRDDNGRHGRGAVTAWRKIDGVSSGSARIAHHQSNKKVAPYVELYQNLKSRGNLRPEPNPEISSGFQSNGI